MGQYVKDKVGKEMIRGGFENAVKTAVQGFIGGAVGVPRLPPSSPVLAPSPALSGVRYLVSSVGSYLALSRRLPRRLSAAPAYALGSDGVVQW